jgi:hypothetical protein
VRSRFWRVSVLAMALVGALIVAPILPVAADTIPPTQYTPVPLTDMTGADYLFSQPDGGVTLGCSGGTTRTKRISAAGDVTQDIPNAALQDAVNAANNVQQIRNFEYVDPNYSGSPFQGHELCMADGYFNGVQAPPEYTFHPNVSGQDAYRQVLLRHLG